MPFNRAAAATSGETAAGTDATRSAGAKQYSA
jgi:hypothetical protein